MAKPEKSKLWRDISDLIIIMIGLAILIFNVYAACTPINASVTNITSTQKDEIKLDQMPNAITVTPAEVNTITSNPCSVWENKECETQECFKQYKQCWLKQNTETAPSVIRQVE